eukprot:SAG31_NODE_1735_length_7410_cov_2.762960_5_plen_130_part_00
MRGVQCLAVCPLTGIESTNINFRAEPTYNHMPFLCVDDSSSFRGFHKYVAWTAFPCSDSRVIGQARDGADRTEAKAEAEEEENEEKEKFRKGVISDGQLQLESNWCVHQYQYHYGEQYLVQQCRVVLKY